MRYSGLLKSGGVHECSALRYNNHFVTRTEFVEWVLQRDKLLIFVCPLLHVGYASIRNSDPARRACRHKRTTQVKILLVASSDAERGYLNKAFRESANSVTAVDDVRYALYLSAQEPFDAVVIAGAGATQFDVLADTLPSFAALPGTPAIVLALSGATPEDRVRMLRLGADACFVQPYSFLEMLERMLALHRASNPHSMDAQTQAAIELDALTRELVQGDTRISMTKREFLLIECLLRHANAPVARDTLIRYAWPERDDVDPSSVNLAVSRLRRKLAAHGFHCKVDTISRFGYQLSTR
jgi:two-component system, OmpR family, response regulator